MSNELNILLTNDDGYQAGGIHALSDMMRQFGRITAVAPKFHQSGMSMAVSMGGRAIAYKELPANDGVRWFYLDATPASCVKYGLDEIFWPEKPDVVVCGVNHGSNAATAANYSGTLGAAEEAALNGILGIGVSLDTMSMDADFSVVNEYFPDIFRKLWKHHNPKSGIYYNVNFLIFRHRLSRASVWGIRGWDIGRRSSSLGTRSFSPKEAFVRRIWGTHPSRRPRTGRPFT